MTYDTYIMARICSKSFIQQSEMKIKSFTTKKEILLYYDWTSYRKLLCTTQRMYQSFQHTGRWQVILANFVSKQDTYIPRRPYYKVDELLNHLLAHTSKLQQVKMCKKKEPSAAFFFSSQQERFDQFQNQILQFLLFYAVKSKALCKALNCLNIQHNRVANTREQARNETYEEIRATPNNIRQKYPNSNAQEPPLTGREEALIRSRGFLEPHFFTDEITRNLSSPPKTASFTDLQPRGPQNRQNTG